MPPYRAARREFNRPRVAALADALLLRTGSAYVEVDQGGRWTTSSKIPIESVGLGEHDLASDIKLTANFMQHPVTVSFARGPLARRRVRRLTFDHRAPRQASGQ
ncbi:hypothetical protein DIE15_23470 [Burkholderia sp. Bp9031]|nr:hypothetical protein DIE15_23470 [Burkholderia sp. Bp9031]